MSIESNAKGSELAESFERLTQALRRFIVAIERAKHGAGTSNKRATRKKR